jgi:hypothetical protein
VEALIKGNTVPKKVFTIKNTGQTVEIQYNWLGRNVVVSLGDREIGRFKRIGSLKQGQLFKTPIGDIHIEHKQTMLSGSGYEVWYDNRLLSGSLSDPARHWRTGFKTAIGLGLFNIVIGGIAVLAPRSSVASMFPGPYPLIFGIVLLILGLWSWQRRSGIALGLAAFIFGGDAVLSIILLLRAGAIPNINMTVLIVPLMVRAAFVMLMGRGAGAAWDLEPEHEKVKNSY